MINRIKNEYIKIGIFKLLFSIIILVLLTILFYKYSENVNEYVYTIITFIGLDTCILFSSIISNEYDNGTFRFYLTKPVKRYKIFIYKYLSIFIYMLVLILIIYFTYSLLSKTLSISIIKLLLKSSIPLLLMLSIIMIISTIFKSSSISTSICISIFLLGNLVSQILFGFNITIVEYSFLPYLDFSIFSDLNTLELMNNELNINLSLNRGIIIDISYAIIIFIISIYLFMKKDINN